MDFGGDSQADLAGRLAAPAAAVFGRAYLTAFDGAVWTTVALAAGNALGFQAAIIGNVNSVAPTTAVVRHLISFTLHDSGVDGGAATSGWLDVVATGRGSGEFGRIEVLRFIFDDVVGSPAPTGVSHASAAFAEFGAAVPEPSGLGLLALGAVGVVARRRRAVAA